MSAANVTPQDLTAFGGFPLNPITLSSFLKVISRSDRGMSAVSGDMPFNIDQHPAARSHVAVQMIDRLKEDVKVFADQQNQGMVPRMLLLLDNEIAAYVSQPSGAGVRQALQQVDKLLVALTALKDKDMTDMLTAMKTVIDLANKTDGALTPSAASASASARASPSPSPKSPPVQQLVKLVPPPMTDSAKDWQELKTADGQLYYFHAKTNVTTWEKPDVLKTKLELEDDAKQVYNEMSTDDGKIYYHSSVNNKTTWEKPKRGFIRVTSDTSASSVASASASPVSDFAASAVSSGEGFAGLAFRLLRYGNVEPTLWFEFLVSQLLSTTSDSDLLKLNPFLTVKDLRVIYDLTVSVMLRVIRVGHINRCLQLTYDLQALLSDVMQSKADASMKIAISLKSASLAELLATKRHYMKEDKANGRPGIFVYEPRFLVFEFADNMMLRESQVQIVDKFMTAANGNSSVCHQMIMGAGKTTVVGPLLALLLGDGEHLVTQIMPNALLELSRSVLRASFSALIQKPVYTFTFDRQQTVTPGMYKKLLKAKERRAVVVAAPTAIKSFKLKFIEILHNLDRFQLVDKGEDKGLGNSLARVFGIGDAKARAKAELERKELAISMRAQAVECAKILQLFREGALILDEVDLLLHPLKSELNWPLGRKEPLDLTQNKLGRGLRWELVWHLIDSLFYATTGTMSVSFQESREANAILTKIKQVIEQGAAARVLQRTPHLILLNKSFYDGQLRPLLARWLLLWLNTKQMSGITDEQCLSFLMNGPRADEALTQMINNRLSGEHIKLLNLGYDWLRSLLPFILGKVSRVTFGLLSAEDLKRAIADNGSMPKSRRLMAVPFVGKDVPSPSSEFSHPDVRLGLSILAFRYEGLRRTDFMTVMETLRDDMEQELIPFNKRKACIKFVSWVESAGARVRGWHRETEEEKEEKRKRKERDELKTRQSVDPKAKELVFNSPRAAVQPLPDDVIEAEGLDGATDIWPLQLLDFHDTEQMDIVYELLRYKPHIVYHYLVDIVFPDVMRFQGLKLSSNGQSLGGSMMFDKRLGFSGTPSDLLPLELGKCQYEKGTDGKILHYMTNPDICKYTVLPDNWSVKGLLDFIAAKSAYHSMIDTGALVTGMTNSEVAKYLLENGLDGFDGVVFLDELDRKMIMLRSSFVILPLAQCGIPLSRMFVFFDQIHTTGMDVRMVINAKACQTLGKDMTFRDYAQGAFRMRQIGAGQTIDVLIIPEVKRLIQAHVAVARGSKPSADGSDPVSLVDISAWLVINSMRLEKVQFNMLCEQSIENVWRKRAWATVLDTYQRVGTETSNAITQASVDVFRERVDYSIENVVPTPLPFVQKLEKMIREHATFLQDATDQAAVKQVLTLVSVSQKKPEFKEQDLSVQEEASKDRSFNSEQVQEQEQEQEQEQGTLCCCCVLVLCSLCTVYLLTYVAFVYILFYRARTRAGARTRDGDGGR